MFVGAEAWGFSLRFLSRIGVASRAGFIWVRIGAHGGPYADIDIDFGPGFGAIYQKV